VARPANSTTSNKAQGSSENISSLSAVIQRNPRIPKATMCAAPLCRGGQYQAALKDFDTAIQLNPNSSRPIRNARSIQRFLGNQKAALDDYNPFDPAINGNYDAAYIGAAQSLTAKRVAPRTLQRLPEGNPARHTDARAYHNRGLIYQSQGQHKFAIEDFSTAISLAPDAAETLQTAAAFPIWPRTTKTTPLPTSTWRSSSTARTPRRVQPGR